MPNPQLANMYLDLLKRAILGELAAQIPLVEMQPGSRRERLVLEAVRRVGVIPAKRDAIDPEARREGRVFPPSLHADSMIGRLRMDNLHECATTVLNDNIAGDFIETGVWRGGASIFMKGVLAAHGDDERNVWVADSFQGVPPANVAKYPADAGNYQFHEFDVLSVSKDQVRANFERYGLLDDRVKFVEGWFKDTLPSLTNTWSLIRLDGDLYESTMDAMTALYPNLSPGGFLLVDDYEIPACKAAITDYRAEHGITEAIQTVDWTGVYWRRDR